jgi:hypothetical protein
MIKKVCAKIIEKAGWKFINNVPDDLKSFVFIGAPHTSNFDFIPAMAVSHLMQRNARFVIKKEWLSFPLNYFFEPLGAIGVKRNTQKDSKTLSYTDEMAKMFEENKEFVLMIAPEGTRSPNPNWKTGFYYIAQKAKVPIVLGFADFERKEVGLGLIIYPSNFEKDMELIMDFYQHKHGKITKNFELDKKFFKGHS